MDNIGAVLSEAVFSNVWAGGLFGLTQRPEFTMLPSGQSVPTAVPDHPETKTYWLPVDGGYRQITHDQSFAEQLWLHHAYGLAAPTAESHAALLTSQGLAEDFHVSDAALVTAIMGMPELLGHIVAAGYGEADVLAYAHAIVPEIMLTGLPAEH